ncbi:MAG: DUF3024 domain-containing protein [Gemmatimonadaceae bacterium]
MAIPELQRHRIERTLRAYCDDIPADARAQVRLGFSISSSSVELFEERPPWDAPKKSWIRHPIAKFRYVATRGMWELYSIRRDLKWHRYPLMPAARSFDALLAEVANDPICAFWG